jgi:predicted O-methyltransferase YrrM
MNRKSSFLICILVFLSLAFDGYAHGRKNNAYGYKQNYSRLPSPYCDIKILPFDPHGWYQNANQLTEIIKQNDVKIVIEVGSWLGSSTRHIASLLPLDGLVYAIDHWKGSVEHQPGGSAWHSALPYLYQQFLSNIVHAGLAHKIRPFRMDSLEAAQMLQVVPDLVYIDAGHDTESVYKDLNAWFPFVKGHGILCGDDWIWDTVAAAVTRFAKENDLEVYAEINFWQLIE